MEFGIIILAAGSSTRMGTSKQLLLVDGTPLLARSTTIALQSGISNIVVVLGANEIEHRKAIKDLPVDIAVNKDWAQGMGGTLKVGLNHLLQHNPNTNAVIVMVCDQPLLTSEHLKLLKEKFIDSQKLIVASRYANTFGVPALFAKSLFSEIQGLRVEHGAKKIIEAHPDEIEAVDFTEGGIDLDTAEDYRNFLK